MKDVVRRQAYLVQWQELFGNIDTSGICIDVGANIGICSVLYEKLFKFKRVVAYEPVPWTCEIFRKNAELNGLSRTTLHTCCVSDRIGRATVNYDHVSFASASLFSNKKRSVEVKTVALSDVLSGKKVSLLKVDCEGAEFPMLESCVPENVSAMVVEIHPAFCDNFAPRYEALKSRICDVFDTIELPDRVNFNLFCKKK